MRADGKRTKGLSAIERATPYIMAKRVDAQNYVTEYVDEEIIKEYIRSVRRERGIRMTRMAVVIAAYYLAALQHPYINRFVMNGHIYDRNHFCVSFVMLKSAPDGRGIQTTVKVYFYPADKNILASENPKCPCRGIFHMDVFDRKILRILYE